MSLRFFWWMIGGFAFALSLSSCKRSTSAPLPDRTAVIQVNTPDLKGTTYFGKNLAIDFTVTDDDGIAVVQLRLNDTQIWNRVLPQRPKKESFGANVLLNSYKEGEQTLSIVVIDTLKYTFSEKFQVVVDYTGPSIRWLAPSLTNFPKRQEFVALAVEDPIGIQKVEVFHREKKIALMKDKPFDFPLDIRAFPPGLNEIIVQATDKLGNTTSQSFSIRAEGTGLNAPCGQNASCADGLLCVRSAEAPQGLCRQPCAEKKPCESGFRCFRLNFLSACLPLKDRPPSGMFEPCTALQPCGPRLTCVRGKDSGSRCHPHCGGDLPSCPPQMQCTPLGSERVCLPAVLVPRPSEAKLTQACSPDLPCEGSLVCARLKDDTSPRCYQACKSSEECPSPLLCVRTLENDARGLCIAQEKAQEIPPAALYEECGPQKICGPRLFCVSMGTTFRCHPLCDEGHSDCGDGTFCRPISGRSVCLRRCNPNGSDCPASMACTFPASMAGSQVGFVCH